MMIAPRVGRLYRPAWLRLPQNDWPACRLQTTEARASGRDMILAMNTRTALVTSRRGVDVCASSQVLAPSGLYEGRYVFQLTVTLADG